MGRAFTKARVRKYTTAEVDEAMRRLRRLYHDGVLSRRDSSSRRRVFKPSKEESSRDAHAEYAAYVRLGRAREFTRRYTEKEFNALIRSCIKDRYAMAESNLFRLMMGVEDKTERLALQKRMIQGQMSIGQLIMELNKRRGSRRGAGGRPLRSTVDESQAYVLLEQRCDQWQRVCEALGHGDEEPSDQRRQLNLNREVVRRLEKAKTAMQGLNEAVGQVLGKMRTKAAKTKPPRTNRRK